MKPPRSGAAIGSLPMALGELDQARRSVACAGGQGPDHLDQLHQRHRIEEVQAAEAVGAPGAGGQLGDAQRRGVRREDGVLADDGFDLRVGLPLRLDVLDDRLDHQVAVGEIAVGGGARQPSEQLRLGLGGHLALGDAAVEELVDATQPLGQRLVVHLEHDRLEPRRRRDLRDPAAHQSATQHADRLHRVPPAAERLPPTRPSPQPLVPSP